MIKSKGGKFIEKILDSNNFFLIICILGIIGGLILTFLNTDTKPATEKDYEPLLKIQNSLIEDFNNVYNYPNADIFISNSNITVTVENDECSLNIIFDKNNKYIYTEKTDKVCPIWLVIVFGFMAMLAITVFVSLLSFIILFALQDIFERIYIKKQRKKIPYDNITLQDK